MPTNQKMRDLLDASISDAEAEQVRKDVAVAVSFVETTATEHSLGRTQPICYRPDPVHVQAAYRHLNVVKREPSLWARLRRKAEKFYNQRRETKLF